MMKKIKLTIGGLEVRGELNDTQTATKVWESLPIEGRVNTWGEEIYFSIPVKAEAENSYSVVSLGDIGYWPPGSAFCMFFGKTPISTEDEIRPASEVNLIGKFYNEFEALKSIKDGEKIVVERIEEE
jgi:hypothetical protein